MQHTPFGKTGLSVSRLGFGGAPVGYLKVDQEKVTRILQTLLDAGVNLLDTAASYPGSEALIAEAIGGRRDSVVIVSKCGSKVSGVSGAAWSASLIEQTVDRSLKNLKTDRLDVMLLHSCDLQTLQKGEALGALVKAREAGKIRFAGYSGDNEALAYAATLPDVAVVETSVNIADQANIDNGLKVCVQHQIGVLAKRPIANAAWKDLDEQQGLYKDYAKTYTDRLKQMNLEPAKLGFRGEFGAAWSELALRFTLSQPGVHTAIIGTTNPQNAGANIAAAEKGALPESIVHPIRDAFHAANANHDWTGQT